MGSCHCCWKDCLAEEEVALLPDNLSFFYVVVVLFLQVIFPLDFSFCFFEDNYFSACSAPQIPASFLVPDSIFKGF